MATNTRYRTRNEMRLNYRTIASRSGPMYNTPVAEGWTSPTGRFRTMTDVVTPHFEKKRNQGQVIFNPMEQTRYEFQSQSVGAGIVQVTPSNWVGQKTFWDGDRLGAFLGHPVSQTDTPHVLPDVLALNVDAVRKIAETKSTANKSNANLLVTAAEYRQALKLVPDLLRNVGNFYRGIDASWVRSFEQNRNAWLKTRDVTRAARELWLATRFGLRPMISDIAGVLKALAQVHDESKLDRWTQRGTSSQSTSSVVSFPYNSNIVLCTLQKTSHNEVQCRAMSLWEGHLDLMDDIGIGLRHVPEAVVDLISFSFVWNWFVNVNDFFASIGQELKPSWHALGGCVVTRRVNTTTWQCLPDSVLTGATAYAYQIIRPISGLATATYEVTNRTPGLPKRSLVLRPDLGAFTRDARLLDAAALLGQRLRMPGILQLVALSRTSTGNGYTF